MTTNYLALELTNRMEYEERLRDAERSRQLARCLAMSSPGIGSRWLQVVRNFIRSTFASNPQQASKPTSLLLTQIHSDAEPAGFSSALAKRMPSEDEWMLLFRMVQNRKLSVEQVAQLLVAMQ